jgi:hypothetical protein
MEISWSFMGIKYADMTLNEERDDKSFIGVERVLWG